MLNSHSCDPYLLYVILLLFFFNDTATTEIYTLSLHDALPISVEVVKVRRHHAGRWLIQCNCTVTQADNAVGVGKDRKSTRLNSSHDQISYAVFCLKKKKKKPDMLLTDEIKRTLTTEYINMTH